MAIIISYSIIFQMDHCFNYRIINSYTRSKFIHKSIINHKIKTFDNVNSSTASFHRNLNKTFNHNSEKEFINPFIKEEYYIIIIINNTIMRKSRRRTDEEEERKRRKIEIKY